MFKVKNTGRAIGISAVIVCLCFAMLLGTTFAWFTDNVSTKRNTITTGKFDINILDANDKTLVDEVLAFVYDDNGTLKEFESPILWEPNMTVRSEDFTIANEGNYALKFRIDDVFANATKGANDINTTGNLKDVMSFTIYDKATGEWYYKYDYKSTDANKSYYNPAFSAGMVAPVEQGEIVLYPVNTADPADSSKTLPSEMTFYAEIHMDYDAGNEYQECSLEGLAISVFAAQYNFEKDSAGTAYDTGRAFEEAATPYDGANELLEKQQQGTNP
ncbi:MAG: SipW-dependent-type signal peptide-containing protein [Clostridia bacterium]|nr:SipW-dependent-type signal peptide-containing protein [Clostridia bacterium]